MEAAIVDSICETMNKSRKAVADHFGMAYGDRTASIEQVIKKVPHRQ